MPGPGTRWILYRATAFGLFCLLFVYHELTEVLIAAVILLIVGVFFFEKQDSKGKPLKKMPFQDDRER